MRAFLLEEAISYLNIEAKVSKTVTQTCLPAGRGPQRSAEVPIRYKQ